MDWEATQAGDVVGGVRRGWACLQEALDLRMEAAEASRPFLTPPCYWDAVPRRPSMPRKHSISPKCRLLWARCESTASSTVVRLDGFETDC